MRWLAEIIPQYIPTCIFAMNSYAQRSEPDAHTYVNKGHAAK